jgi:hypothetical protein
VRNLVVNTIGNATAATCAVSVFRDGEECLGFTLPLGIVATLPGAWALGLIASVALTFTLALTDALHVPRDAAATSADARGFEGH